MRADWVIWVTSISYSSVYREMRSIYHVLLLFSVVVLIISFCGFLLPCASSDWWLWSRSSSSSGSGSFRSHAPESAGIGQGLLHGHICSPCSSVVPIQRCSWSLSKCSFFWFLSFSVFLFLSSQFPRGHAKVSFCSSVQLSLILIERSIRQEGIVLLKAPGEVQLAEVVRRVVKLQSLGLLLGY